MPANSTPKPTKIDARLSYLLSLPKQRLEKLKAIEDAMVKSREEQLQTILLTVADPLERARRLSEVGAHTLAPLTAGVHFRDGKKFLLFPTREPYISAFVRFDGSAADLERLGSEVYTQAGDIFTISAPLSAIPALQASAAVRFVELARPQALDLDQAVPQAQIDVLRRMTPAVTGKDVIIGIIDSVLDIHHPDFRAPDDTTGKSATRVRYLWDQNLEPQSGERAPPILPGMTRVYGVEYNRATIDLELERFAQGRPAYETVRHGKPPVAGRPVDPHGTEVAGAAAGNGRASQGRYVGAAPEADLIFVSVKRPYPYQERVADDAAVADAFAYIFARAAQLGMPCIVNRSGSDNQGPHDGTLAGEARLDHWLQTPGRAITLAAGNSNRSGSHACGRLSAWNPVELKLQYKATANGKLPDSNDAIEIWYDGHDRFDVTLTIPTQPPHTIGPVSPGDPRVEIALPGGTKVSVTSTVNDGRNGDNLVYVAIIVQEAGTHVPLGDWIFTLTGTTVVNGTFHAWVDRNNRLKSTWEMPFLDEDRLTLGVPATAKLPITVGANDKRSPPVIDANSGRGPTRDGRVKPDITTVGVDLMLPNLRDMSAINPGDFYIADRGGTSFSAPFVAGACALLFQCRGANLSCADLKQILQNTAGSDGIVTTGSTAVPNDAFGFGYLRMANACATPAPTIDVWLRDHPGDTGEEPSAGAVCWLSPDIEILDCASDVAPNATRGASSGISNVVRVTVHNRGSQPACNTEVFLYWAHPATNLPVPDAWNSTGIFTGQAPDFAHRSNRIVVPLLGAAGTSGDSVQVRFGWGAPASGSVKGYVCFMVRLEHENDPSQLGTGGSVIVSAKNNIALRNVYAVASGAANAQTSFYFVGSSNADSLQVDSELAAGRIELRLPIQALPWRYAALIEQYGPRSAYDGCGTDDPLNPITAVLHGEEVRQRTDIEGAESLTLSGGIATIVLEHGKQRLWLPSMRVAPGARLPVAIEVTGARLSGTHGHVHVGQRSAGRLIGGMSVEFRA